MPAADPYPIRADLPAAADRRIDQGLFATAVRGRIGNGDELLACIGNRGSATGPTQSTSSSGASNSVVPAAKKSPGRRTLPNTAARSVVIMDMKPVCEMMRGEVNSVAGEIWTLQNLAAIA